MDSSAHNKIGKPPKWQPPSTTTALHEDGGIYFRDQNNARFPTLPSEPAVRAILNQNPEFDLAEIGVFGCGNTIGSLLSFARDEERTFRFGVELVHNSLFLVRKTNTVRETIEEVRGYGHTFPEAYTSWERDVQGSASYQRIIKYDFAGLKCFVRSESDGYLPEKANLPSTIAPDKAPAPQLNLSQFSTLGLRFQPLSDASTLIINEAGQVVPQNAIFDLKTRGKKRNSIVSVDDFLHRLWVNQTPNFILAFHTYGKFEQHDIHIIDVKNKVKNWELQNAAVLSRLGSLLHKLIDVAKNNGQAKFEYVVLDRAP